MSRQYITTAIDYPNAPPHMGHVLEKIIADVCARWFRLRGDDVRLQIGTDEHGVKIEQTARKEGMTPRQLVDRNVPLFQDIYKRLGISADVFIRTSDRKTHWPTAIGIWNKLQQAGALEKRMYAGLYCAGCERFITKKELTEGLCPDHKIPPQQVNEENWFFLLSREQQWLANLLKKEYRIVPEFRSKETLMLLGSGLEDVSFSRPKSSIGWGIPVPGDENHTMYVWCDALTNYISGLGFFTDHEEAKWWNQAEVMHVIGKDIARFHALIWPAMLKCAKIRTPDKLLIHGFLTSEGEKMSKTTGNVVIPDDVIGKYGVDALRFFLSHEIPVGNDGDFSWKRFSELYDAKLRNQLGNLLNRVLVLLKKEGKTISVPASPMYASLSDEEWKIFGEKMNALDLHASIQQTFELVATLNMDFDHARPWALKGEARLEKLSRFAESLRHVALMLLPFVPETAQKISMQLNVPYAGKMLEKDFVLTDDLKRWGSQKAWLMSGAPEILFPAVV